MVFASEAATSDKAGCNEADKCTEPPSANSLEEWKAQTRGECQ